MSHHLHMTNGKSAAEFLTIVSFAARCGPVTKTLAIATNKSQEAEDCNVNFVCPRCRNGTRYEQKRIGQVDLRVVPERALDEGKRNRSSWRASGPEMIL